MDLMIDCMPLYEMIEDDMKNIINCCVSSSNSPNCLSDEEQLALTSCSMFDDLFFLQNENQPSEVTAAPVESLAETLDRMSEDLAQSAGEFCQIEPEPALQLTYPLNESFGSSLGSSISSYNSSAAHSPQSLSASSSSLCAALASTTFQNSLNSAGSSTCSSQLSSPSTTPLSHQYTQVTNAQVNKPDSPSASKYMQDAYLNTNLYPAINPMDLNRNYTQIPQQPHQPQTQLYDPQQQTAPNRLKSLTISKQQLTSSYSSPAKRGKFAPSNNSNLVELLKLDTKCCSDGDESSSSDSNSSNPDYSKPLLVATKLEPYQLKNVTNCKEEPTSVTCSTGQNLFNVHTTTTPTQQQHATPLNLIKINGPKENNFYGTTSTTNKLPVVSKISDGHKTIIQYKQLQSTLLKPPHNTIINLNTTAPLHTAKLLTSTSDQTKVFPKPPYSYSCLIAMALRNSDSGHLPVSDIYDFIIENFPYYKTARDGWKNSIRHNLSLNKCFEKIENPTNGSKKGCLWALNPDKCKKLEEECKRCRQRDPVNIRLSMSRPDDLNKIERGEQRLKKFSMQQTTSRKVPETTAPPPASVSGQISLSPPPVLPDESFLLDWTNKNSSIILKEEDQYFDDSDIKFDPILLNNLGQPERTGTA